jgi:hypothetical protein
VKGCINVSHMAAPSVDVLISSRGYDLLSPYTHLGDVEEIFNPLGVSLEASES